ncbi:serine protease [Candidatus Parcubacteria bacterium]|nr:serine protease [Candidatus Parcubacteria bacterium]
MDLEQLTKHQIILLTLLVSFVTSIVTGIVTVSLMDQAPASVTQTINRIVEHTVEKVVPSDLTAAVTTEKTVVVKEDDLTAQTIGKVQQSVIRITTADNPDALLARGVVVGKGLAITDRHALVASGAQQFQAILNSGERVPLSLVGGTSTIAVAVLGTTTLPVAPIGNVSKVQLGQSVIRIGGLGSDRVAVGVIAQLPGGDHQKFIESSVSSPTPGSVLFTLFGEVIGIMTSDALAASTDDSVYSTIEPNVLSF